MTDNRFLNANNRDSRLGFGTSGIMGASVTERGRIELLEHAYNSGITHFDTAPLYGRGEAEKVLGKFSQSKRSEITITTKFGLKPRPLPRSIRPLLPVGRIVNRRLKAIKQLLYPTSNKSEIQNISNNTKPNISHTKEDNYQSASNPARSNQVWQFSGEDIIQSVDESLTKLRTDYIDYLVLHECPVNAFNDDTVAALDQLVRSGKVVKYGTATSTLASHQIIANYPKHCGVTQIAHSLFKPSQLNPPSNASSLTDVHHELGVFDRQLLITHSIFLHSFTEVKRLVAVNQGLRKTISELLECDISQKGNLTRFLLENALFCNANGLVLFSTKDKETISNNCAIESKSRFDKYSLVEASKLLEANSDR